MLLYITFKVIYYQAENIILQQKKTLGLKGGLDIYPHEVELYMANKKNIVIKVKYPAAVKTQETNSSKPEMITEWNIKRIVIALGALAVIIALSIFFMVGSDQNSSNTEIAPPDKPNSKAADQKSVITRPLTVNNAGKKAESLAKNKEKKNNLSSNIPNTVNVKSEAKLNITAADSKKQNLDIKIENTLKPAISKDPSENNGNKAITKQLIRSVLSYDIINKEPVHIINTSVRISKDHTVKIYYFTELKDMENRTIYHEWLKDGKIVFRRRINIGANRWRTTSSRFFNSTALGTWKVRTLDKKGNFLDEKEFKIVLID